MRIAFVHQPWNRVVPGAPNGSVPIWTSEVSRRLSSEHEVYVYSRRFPEMASTEIVGDLSYLRIDDPLDPWLASYVEPITRLGRRDRSPFSSRLFYPQFYRRAARDMARRGIDIVHVHSFPQAASIIRQEHPSARIVVHLHVEWLNLLPPRVARRQARHADLIIGCSEYLAEQMRRALPEDAARIRTVYNAVDVERFRPAEEERGPASAPTVLFVGRISPEKGIHVLLDAFEKALERTPELRLDIIGHDGKAPIHLFEHLADTAIVASLRIYHDSTPWARLRTWLRSRYPRRLAWFRDTDYGAALRRRTAGRLASRVRFLGLVANDDLPQHYRRARILVLPSLTETFGIPLVEAMACGTPTVASRTGGIPEIVDDGVTGLLVPVFDADGLERAIGRLLADPEQQRRMGRVGREKVLARFSWESVVASLLGHYQRLLDEGGGRH